MRPALCSTPPNSVSVSGAVILTIACILAQRSRRRLTVQRVYCVESTVTNTMLRVVRSRWSNILCGTREILNCASGCGRCGTGPVSALNTASPAGVRYTSSSITSSTSNAAPDELGSSVPPPPAHPAKNISTTAATIYNRRVFISSSIIVTSLFH